MPWFDLTSAEESTEPQGDYSLNTTITDNGDGTYTMTLYDHPVKYVDEKGDVQDISLEIASSADGSYKTKANDIHTVFPKKISDGITLSGNGVSVKLTPSVQPPSEREVAAKPSEGVIERLVNGNTSSTVFDGPPSPQGEGSVGNDALVVPSADPIIADSTVTRLDSETVSYYYDNRTTLEYSLTYTGFKEDIVVSEYTGQTEYHFLLETGGLTLTKIDESYYLTDAEGNIKATLGDIIIFTADERNNALGSMTHTTVREDQQYIVTIHIDAEYLKDEKTKYPIRIDPTIEITYDGNGASAIQDVTLNQNSGSSGTSGSLYVGKRNTYGISRTLMKFPGLNLNSIPSNCTIDSAYIEIRDLMCETTAMTVNAAMFMGNDWNESTANWSNTNPNLYTPISGGSVSVSYSNGTAVSPNHRYSINITKAVRLWKSGFYPHAKGIILKADDSVENGSSALYKTFASYNRASNKPSLKINYTSNVTHTAYGWLGFVNSSVINGWVWCSNHPSETLDVVLTITKTGTNQSWRTVGPASIYRSDVKDAGYGTGNYGFSCSMGDWASFPYGYYSVSAVAILPSGGTYTLHASPKTYNHSPIRLNAAQLNLNVGDTTTLVASTVSSDVSLNDLEWSSSVPHVATVLYDGTVTAYRSGMTVITVTCGAYSASCTVNSNQILTYPDTLITDSNTRNRIVLIKSMIDENEIAYYTNQLTGLEMSSINDQLQKQADIIRADYITIGTNPTSQYAYELMGGSVDTGCPLGGSLTLGSEGFNVIVVQRALEVLGYYEPTDGDVYGEFGDNTFDAASVYQNLMRVDAQGNTVFNQDSYNTLFSSSNIDLITYEGYNQLNKLRTAHNYVAWWTANKVDGTYKMSDNRITNGNKNHNYYGYADVLKDIGVCTYIWEVKPNKQQYYVKNGIGDKQLETYFEACSNVNNQQIFSLPLAIGYDIGQFTIPYINGQFIDVHSYDAIDPADRRNALVLYDVVSIPGFIVEKEPQKVDVPEKLFNFSRSYSIDTSEYGVVTVKGLAVVGGVVLCVLLASSTGGASLIFLGAF